MPLINTQPPESAQDERHEGLKRRRKRRRRVAIILLKDKLIDALAHCSFGEHTRDRTRVYPHAAVTHTSRGSGERERGKKGERTGAHDAEDR